MMMPGIMADRSADAGRRQVGGAAGWREGTRHHRGMVEGKGGREEKGGRDT